MILEILSTILAIVLIGYLANRLFFSGTSCNSKNRIDGKVVIITGANTGIGYETALDLARRGAHVIIACRDMKKAEKAAYTIKTETNNNNVDTEYLDLSDLDTVRSFAKKFLSKFDRLDILINNAGLMMCPYQQTKQGFEMQFGVNHLGHFLLTNLLLDIIKRTKGSRIINVSSRAHEGFSINWPDINWEKSYSPIRAYSQSKLANLLFTRELSKRLGNDGVLAFAVHPGAVRTEILRYTGEGIFFLLPHLVSIGYPIWWMISKSCAEGAQTTIYCAVADGLEKFNGFYFSDCKPKKPSKNAINRDDAKRLWEISENLLKLVKL